jgi:FkbM family methyltransferase
MASNHGTHGIKDAVKAVMARTPWRIVHAPLNRFDAFDDSLTQLRTAGFAPDLIIDGGAHIGDFARLAARHFPDARLHLIEPQAACQPALAALGPRFTIHAVALGTEADADAGLRLAASETPNTGAHIAEAGQAVACATLDRLFLGEGARNALLKLDLQGFELQALQGGEALLAGVEVILTEVSFFAQAYEPPILALMTFLDAHGFELFDVAALSGRTRDQRLRQGDFIFVRRGSPISADTRWA